MVYWIQGQSTHIVKIGKADNVVRRLRGLQAASPDKLTVLAVILNEDNDHYYHSKFRASWSHGEWFKPSAELLTFIGQIPQSEFTGLSVQIGNASAVLGTGDPYQQVRDELADELTRTGDLDQATAVRSGFDDAFVAEWMQV